MTFALCTESPLHTPVRRYTRERLFNWRRKSMVSIDSQLVTILRELCILRYRGCRAGRNKIRQIQSTQPSTRTHRQYLNNKSNTRPGVQSSNLLPVICNDTVKSPTGPSRSRIIPRI